MESAHIFYKELPIDDDNIFTAKKSNEYAVTGLSINQDTDTLIEVTTRKN